MTEHAHDLHYVGGENPDVYCIDIDCNKRFAPDEVMRRLSATERLSAKEAKNIAAAGILLAGKVGVMGPLPRMAALFAYATALEGKNEKS